MSVVIYHNPKCSKSRETLTLLEARNIEPEIVKYLDETLTVEQLKILLEKRPSTGIWGGLWSLPELASEESIVLHTEQRFATQVTHVIPLSSFRHTFSHYHLDICPSQVHISRRDSVMEEGKYQWFNHQDAMTQGLPAPVRLILEQVEIDQNTKNEREHT